VSVCLNHVARLNRVCALMGVARLSVYCARRPEVRVNAEVNLTHFAALSPK
jgi:hypothetical protein